MGGIWKNIQLAQFFRPIFVHFYLLTFSHNYVILLVESEGTTMTQEERDKILRFVTQNLIATLCYDFRKGHEIWEEEHLKNFYKTQNFLDKMLDKPQTM